MSGISHIFYPSDAGLVVGRVQICSTSPFNSDQTVQVTFQWCGGMRYFAYGGPVWYSLSKLSTQLVGILQGTISSE